MTISSAYVGIDISKRHLDIFDTASGRGERLANTLSEVAALARRCAAAGSSVVFEATGSYDAALAHAMAAQGVPFARVNPGRARHFARAAGYLAKTDRIDARMLASLGQCLDPPPASPANPERETLALLHRRRDQLVAARKQERTRAHECRHHAVAASIAGHIAWLDGEIATLEAAIADLIKASATLSPAARLLRSVPGVGPVTAATLLALAPELGSRSPGPSPPSPVSPPSMPTADSSADNAPSAEDAVACARPSTSPPSPPAAPADASVPSTGPSDAPESRPSSPSSLSPERSSSPSMPSQGTTSPSIHKHSCPHARGRAGGDCSTVSSNTVPT